MTTMNELPDREAFLLAIFDAPDDDLPRLVYADWLEEHDEPLAAEFLRLDLELCRPSLELAPPEQIARYQELLPLVYPNLTKTVGVNSRRTHRGFPSLQVIVIDAEVLMDAPALSRLAITQWPNWYYETHLKVASGLVESARQIQTLLTSPVFQRVVHLDLSGSIVDVKSDSQSLEGANDLGISDFEYRPVITVQAVEALVNAREARRLLSIDLRNNDLDNDAARAIMRSKNLIRLKQLDLLDGNQLRGKTWAQLQQQFEGGVVQ